MIRLDKITKQNGRQLVFIEASAALQRGEKVGLVGPNGAGKTTLFNMISGFLKPDAGTVSVRAPDGTWQHPGQPADFATLGVGRTFQIVQPFAAMTVEENIMVGAFHATATSAKRGRSRARPPSEWGSRRGSEARRAVSPSAASSGSRSPA